MLLSTFLTILALGPLARAADGCKGPPVKVLIAGFEPIKGHVQNGSELVAREMAKLKSTNPCIIYETCLLPVDYDRGAEAAKECFEKSQPAMMIALGESGCQVQVETKAHNIADAKTPDNRGLVRSGQKIESDAAGNELLTLPAADMYCATEKFPGPDSAVSASPGFYVCNEVAFKMARYLKPKQVPFGFIHVPEPHKCKSAPLEAAKKVDAMTQAAIRTLGQPTSVFAKRFGGATGCAETLGSATKLSRQTANVSGGVTAACRAEMIDQLRRTGAAARRLKMKNYQLIDGKSD